MLPNDLLDPEKTNHTKRSELRRTYMRCIHSSNFHINRLSRQNQHLDELRVELDVVKTGLEKRVASRTARFRITVE